MRGECHGKVLLLHCLPELSCINYLIERSFVDFWAWRMSFPYRYRITSVIGSLQLITFGHFNGSWSLQLFPNAGENILTWRQYQKSTARHTSLPYRYCLLLPLLLISRFFATFPRWHAERKPEGILLCDQLHIGAGFGMIPTDGHSYSFWAGSRPDAADPGQRICDRTE